MSAHDAIVTKIDAYAGAIRVWPGEIGDIYATMVALFILDRTVGWNKKSEVITTAHFLEGIEKDGVRYASGLPMCRRRLFLALDHLEEIGLLTRKTAAFGRLVSYTLDMEWEGMASLKLPKKPVNRQRTVGALNAPHGARGALHGALHAPIREDRKEKIGKEDGAAAPTLQEQVARAQAKSAEARLKRTAKANAHPSPEAMFDLFWLPALRETFPAFRPLSWNAKQRGKVRHFIRAWTDKDTPVGQFFDWAVRSWKLVQETKFRFVPKVTYPSFPDIDFLMGFKNAFLQSWGDRANLTRKATMSLRDQERENLRERGIEGADADRVLEERRARRKTASDLEARERKLAEEAAALELRKAKLDRMPVRTVNPGSSPYRRETVKLHSAEEVKTALDRLTGVKAFSDDTE